MSTHYIFYKSRITNGFYQSTGFCSFNEKRDTPIHLTDVNGTLTITDRVNTIKINIINDMVSIPILVDDDITCKLTITLQEIPKDQVHSEFGLNMGHNGKYYELSLGKKFKTCIIVVDKEIKELRGRVKSDGFSSNGYSLTEPNILDMNISFKTTGDLQLVLSEK